MQMEYMCNYTVYRKSSSQNTLHDYLFIILFHLYNYQYPTDYPVDKTVTGLRKRKYLLFNFHSKQRLWK